MTSTINTPSTSAVNWFEIPVSNMRAAVGLYSQMLGQALTPRLHAGVPHAVIGNSGALVQDPARPPRRGSGTVVYLHAPQGIPLALARAVEAGAKIVQPLTPLGEHGTFALVEDFDGNLVGLHASR